jgi:hypothetical protein
MIVTEKYAKINWWCPARRHRIAPSGAAGFNMTLFPIKMQWRHALVSWLFPNYFWLTVGRHGKCLGAGCSIWRWHEFNKTGWCGLGPKPGLPAAMLLDPREGPAGGLPDRPR